MAACGFHASLARRPLLEDDFLEGQRPTTAGICAVSLPGRDQLLQLLENAWERLVETLRGLEVEDVAEPRRDDGIAAR